MNNRTAQSDVMMSNRTTQAQVLIMNNLAFGTKE